MIVVVAVWTELASPDDDPSCQNHYQDDPNTGAYYTWRKQRKFLVTKSETKKSLCQKGC